MLMWGAMLNFQWPVWESESDNTKFNTPAFWPAFSGVKIVGGKQSTGGRICLNSIPLLAKF